MSTPPSVAPRNAGLSLEKRKSRRFACNLKASWRLMGASDLQFMPAIVQDISRTGVALQVLAQCKQGVILSFQLEGMAEQFAGPWLGRAVNVRHQAGTWVIGCSLFREFADADLQALLGSQPEPARSVTTPPPTRSVTTSPPPARFVTTPPPATATLKAADLKPAGNGPERRKAPRRAGKRVAVIIASSNATGKRYVGRVVDGSTGGLALAMPRAPLVGSVVKVRASNAGLAIPWTTVRVKHCRREYHQWIVGCQFTEPLPASILELFC